MASASSQAPPTRSVSDFLRPMTQQPLTLASDSYAQLCKVVLANRLKNMFGLTAAATALALNAAVFDPARLPGSLLKPGPALLYAPLAFLGTIPIYVLHKQTVTTALAPTPTRFSQLARLHQPSFSSVLLAYLLGSVPILFAYLWCSSLVSPSAQLGWFFTQQSLAAQVNERRIYLATLQLAVALYAAAEHVYNARSRVEFDADSTATIPTRLRAKAQGRLVRVARSVWVVNVAVWVVYVALRRSVLRTFIVHFGGQWAMPYMYSILRHNIALSPSLVARALALSSLTLALFELVHVVFAVYATHPLAVSQFAPRPNAALLSGLASPDGYFQQFAFQELAQLTLTNQDRRKSIFTEIKKDASKGGAWQDISRAALVLVGEELQRAKGRGKLPPKAVDGAAGAALSPALAPRPSTSQLRAVAVKEENVFQPVKKTFLDTLTAHAAPAPASAKPAATSTAVSTSATASSTTSRVPSIFQTSAANGTATSDERVKPVTAPATKPAVKRATLEETLAKFAPAQVRKVLFKTQPHYEVGVCVARQRQVIWAIQALSNLLCASLTEDPYGLAARDIPRVIEALVLYLQQLDALQKDFTEQSGRLAAEERDQLLGAVESVIVPVQGAIKEGVKSVVDEFAPYISEFKFPPKIAEALQVLVDWG